MLTDLEIELDIAILYTPAPDPSSLEAGGWHCGPWGMRGICNAECAYERRDTTYFWFYLHTPQCSGSADAGAVFCRQQRVNSKQKVKGSK